MSSVLLLTSPDSLHAAVENYPEIASEPLSITCPPPRQVKPPPRSANPFTLLANLIADSLTDKLGEQASTLLAGLFGATPQPKPGMTICRLTKLFLKHCDSYYVFEDGTPSPEVASMERA